jgi:hypothetical protein
MQRQPCGTTLRGNQGRLRSPPKAGPRRGRAAWINRAKGIRSARPHHSPRAYEPHDDRISAATPGSRGLHALERCARRRSRRSRASVRAAISWSSRALLPCRRYDPARWPHPYHGTTRNRCADRHFPRSRSTVGVKVMGSASTQLCVHSRGGMAVGSSRDPEDLRLEVVVASLAVRVRRCLSPRVPMRRSSRPCGRRWSRWGL